MVGTRDPFFQVRVQPEGGGDLGKAPADETERAFPSWVDPAASWGGAADGGGGPGDGRVHRQVPRCILEFSSNLFMSLALSVLA